MAARTGSVGRIDDESLDVVDIVEDFFSGVMITGIASVLLLGLFLLRKYIQWGIDCPSDNRIDGKTVIITGGNTGLGKTTALELAKRGGRIILACRDRKKGEAVARLIKKKTMNPNVYSMCCDLARLHSIREFVEEFHRSEPQLHILINNAAYMGPKSTTEDHIERSFGVNYLGHFLLTKLLVDKMRKNAPCRVINVVSDTYQRGKLDFQDLAMHQNYTIYKAYARSKLSQAIHTMELHRRFFRDCIWTFAVHPGACNTELLRNWPGLTGQFMRVMARILFKTPEQGCQTIIYCAVAEKVREQAGLMIVNCSPTQFIRRAKDYEQARKLWNASLHLIGCDDEIEPDEVEATIHEADTALQDK